MGTSGRPYPEGATIKSSGPAALMWSTMTAGERATSAVSSETSRNTRRSSSPQRSKLEVPGSMPTTRGMRLGGSPTLRQNRSRDVVDRHPVENLITRLEELPDACLVHLHLEGAEDRPGIPRFPDVSLLDAGDPDRRHRVEVDEDAERGVDCPIFLAQQIDAERSRAYGNGRRSQGFDKASAAVDGPHREPRLAAHRFSLRLIPGRAARVPLVAEKGAPGWNDRHTGTLVSEQLGDAETDRPRACQHRGRVPCQRLDGGDRGHRRRRRRVAAVRVHHD